jgi:hypothetical protein
MEKEILYTMKLGEEIRDWDSLGEKREGRVIVLRVPGGWIFTTYCEYHPISCFVPWDNEFLK